MARLILSARGCAPSSRYLSPTNPTGEGERLYNLKHFLVRHSPSAAFFSGHGAEKLAPETPVQSSLTSVQNSMQMQTGLAAAY